MGVITGGDIERQPLLVVEKKRSNTAETVVSPTSTSFSDGNGRDVDGDDTYLAASSSWGSTPFVTANWYGSTSASHKNNRNETESPKGSTTSQSENARHQEHSYQYDEGETNSLLPGSLHLFHRKVIASVRAHTGMRLL